MVAAKSDHVTSVLHSLGHADTWKGHPRNKQKQDKTGFSPPKPGLQTQLLELQRSLMKPKMILK